jgi:hypothetical protein
MPIPLRMPRKPTIWEMIALQRGAQMSPQTATGLGQAIGAEPLRGPLLAKLVNEGKLDPKMLSPQDTKAAGANLDKPGGSLGFLGDAIGGVAGFVGNLGSDIYDATKGFIPGTVHAGEAVFHDITHPFTAAGAFSAPGDTTSEVKKEVVDPQLKYFKQQYGEGNILSNFYEHPLGPILDVATVASLGAGGTARIGSTLANAGKISSESRLARLGSREGRPSLSFSPDLPEGTTGRDMPRMYSARPLRKGLQILTDKAGEYVPPVRKGQLWQARTFEQKIGAARKDSEALQQVNRQVKQLIPVMKDLDPHELQAFDLVVRGINSPEWINEYEQAVRGSMANELGKGANAEDFGRIVDPKLAETRAHISEAAKELAIDPSKSDRLVVALQSYYNTVDQRITHDMDPNQIDPKRNELRDALMALRENRDEAPVQTNTEAAPSTFENLHEFDQRKFDKAEQEGIYVDDLRHDERPPQEAPAPLHGPPELQGLDPHPSHPFPDPTIAPVQVARDFVWHEPTRYQRMFEEDPQPGFKKKQGQFNPSNVTYQNVLQQPFNTYRPNANPLLAGVHRPDARSFVDLIAKHERDVVEQAYSAEVLDKWALKGPDGEPVTVKTDQEAQAKYGPGYTAVHPTAPLHYYSDQTTVADMVSFMDQQGFPVDGPEMKAAVEAIGEDTVLKMTQAARKQDALVIPRDVAEYQRKIENASKPYENPAIRGMARALNVWRTYTLSLMPRWALNTAVGSFLLNTIKGVSPRDYMRAMRLNKATPHEPSIFETPEMGGVNLGNQIGMELNELGMQGGATGTNRVARTMMEKVQGIEDYFRRASMMNSLSKEAKQAIRENGTIIADFERSKGPRTSDEFRDMIHNDPKAVRRALDDVDRFAYNFASLGPFERRVVRQVAPFWGWYRFITGFVYRLPVDYPGRANIIASLGRIGTEHNKDTFGAMPKWLQGNVLGIGKSKTPGLINYFSTAGINPLGSVLNPGSPEGAQGVVQLGQGSPILQAVMAAYGIDPMSGGQLDISPQHGVSPDFTGQLRDENTGEEREVGSVAPVQRALATLLRAFPEARIGERIHSGGRAPYPESIPLIAEYYRDTKPENRYGAGIMEALQQMTGTAIRHFDLGSYQNFRKKGQSYSRRKGQRARKKAEIDRKK